MNKEEAEQILKACGWLYCYNQEDILMHFNNCSQMCSGTLDWMNGESEYECCLYNYASLEETMEALEYACQGNWEEVFK